MDACLTANKKKIFICTDRHNCDLYFTHFQETYGLCFLENYSVSQSSNPAQVNRKTGQEVTEGCRSSLDLDVTWWLKYFSALRRKSS